jgi:hypothetical protein
VEECCDEGHHSYQEVSLDRWFATSLTDSSPISDISAQEKQERCSLGPTTVKQTDIPESKNWYDYCANENSARYAEEHGG